MPVSSATPLPIQQAEPEWLWKSTFPEQIPSVVCLPWKSQDGSMERAFVDWTTGIVYEYTINTNYLAHVSLQPSLHLFHFFHTLHFAFFFSPTASIVLWKKTKLIASGVNRNTASTCTLCFGQREREELHRRLYFALALCGSRMCHTSIAERDHCWSHLHKPEEVKEADQTRTFRTSVNDI